MRIAVHLRNNRSERARARRRAQIAALCSAAAAVLAAAGSERGGGLGTPRSGAAHAREHDVTRIARGEESDSFIVVCECLVGAAIFENSARNAAVGRGEHRAHDGRPGADASDD